MKRDRWLALVLLAVLVLACGGGGGGGGGPTGPSDETIGIVVQLSSFRSGGVIRATLLFDGEEVSRMQWTSSGCSAGCLLAASIPARRGTHTVAIRIDEQTRPSVSYSVFGEVFGGEPYTVVGLPRRDVTLRAGESVTYSIRF